jgi:hypothetical protein
MRALQHCADPFDLLINPEAVLRAVEASSHLQSLKRKICRPLDHAHNSAESQADFDRFEVAVTRDPGGDLFV